MTYMERIVGLKFTIYDASSLNALKDNIEKVDTPSISR